MGDLVVRFLVGGAVISLFATFGDILRPKSFAGLFGAAPSVALATVGLSIHQHGNAYVAYEAKSMLLGAASFFVYAAAASWILRRYKPGTLATTVALLPVWIVISFGLWMVVERGV